MFDIIRHLRNATLKLKRKGPVSDVLPINSALRMLK
jgi:hypothetical protein